MVQLPVKHFAHFTEEELKNKLDAVQKKTLLEMKRKLLEHLRLISIKLVQKVTTSLRLLSVN